MPPEIVGPGVVDHPIAHAPSEVPGNPKQAAVQLSRDIGHGMPSPHGQTTTDYTKDMENRRLPYPWNMFLLCRKEGERTFEQPVNDRVEIDLRGVISHDKGE